MNRPLPPGASTEPPRRHRRRLLLEIPSALLATSVFLRVLLSDDDGRLWALPLIGLALGGSVVPLLRLRALEARRARIVAEHPVDVVGVGKNWMRAPEVAVYVPGRRAPLVLTVVDDRDESRGAPPARGVRYVYDDRWSVIVLADRTLWCRPTR